MINVAGWMSVDGEDVGQMCERVDVIELTEPSHLDLDVDHSRTGLNLAPRHSALRADGRRRRCRIQDGRNELQFFSIESAVWDICNSRRRPNNYCGENPCRRATAETESPLATISATIRALSFAPHLRR